MNQLTQSPQPAPWICAACGVPLETGQIRVQYMGNGFPVSLERCPRCGLVWIPEDLALGKMADVEKTLEDK